MIITIDDKKAKSGKTVLIVDDNPRIRDVFAAAFLSNGFKTCIEAGNGKEGIQAAERMRPDVITLDHSMPVMTGLEAAPVLRRLLPRTPIILFTMFGDSLFIINASKVGVSLVLAKNVPLSTLLAVTHELVDDTRPKLGNKALPIISECPFQVVDIRSPVKVNRATTWLSWFSLKWRKSSFR